MDARKNESGNHLNIIELSNSKRNQVTGLSLLGLLERKCRRGIQGVVDDVGDRGVEKNRQSTSRRNGQLGSEVGFESRLVEAREGVSCVGFFELLEQNREVGI